MHADIYVGDDFDVKPLTFFNAWFPKTLLALFKYDSTKIYHDESKPLKIIFFSLI